MLSHYILGGRGIVRENNAYCSLLRLVNLLTFIQNGGIWKVTLQSRLKKGTHFSCYESVPKGYNVQMSLCLTLTWDAMSRNGQRQGSVVQHSLPLKKSPSAAQLKLLFGDSCSVFNNKWHAHAMRDEPIVRVQTPPTRKPRKAYKDFQTVQLAPYVWPVSWPVGRVNA